MKPTAALTVAVVTLAFAAAAQGATLRLTPAKAPAGASVAASGSGFPVSARGSILLGGRLVAHIRTTAGGSFGVTFRVPRLAHGRKLVVANVRQAHLASGFTIAAGLTPSSITANSAGRRLAVSPTDGERGTTVHAAGKGFAPGALVRLFFAGALRVSTRANRIGSFSSSFVEPSASVGAHAVVARSRGALLVAPFLVTPHGRDPTCGCDQIHLAWPSAPATTLTAVWRTHDTTVASTVRYRQAGTSAWSTANGSLRSSGTTGTLHEVTLHGLTPATSYEYRVLGDAGWSAVYESRTGPPARHADFDFVFVADTGLADNRLATGTQQVADEIVKLRPLLVLTGGDYIHYSSDTSHGTLDDSIDAWFNQMQPIASAAPLMPTYGNHETLLSETFDDWAPRFPTPTGFDSRRDYSFDVGDVHFVSIFAVENKAPLPSATLTWIENDITAAKAAGQRWVIPYFHVSTFADGMNHPSNIALRAQLAPVFERLGVKLVLMAHDQQYTRTYPLRNVTSTSFTRTSTAKDCYTAGDGITWTTVSPGGLLSTQNDDFSQYSTNPAPAWTAVRNNTMHHFARLHVSAAGQLTMTVYGVKGDGTPPVVQDRFRYDLHGCP